MTYSVEMEPMNLTKMQVDLVSISGLKDGKIVAKMEIY